MLNKILSTSFIVLLFFMIFNMYCYATGDLLMDTNTNSIPTDLEPISDPLYEEAVDSYSPDIGTETTGSSDVSVDTDYDVSDEALSITNMINIIFIVVGIVLILLGIAIIIKLK